MADLTAAEVLAEGRRLLAEWRDNSGPVGSYWNDAALRVMGEFFRRHADVLLADPEPPTLTDDELELRGLFRDMGREQRVIHLSPSTCAAVADLIDRITEGTDRG